MTPATAEQVMEVLLARGQDGTLWRNNWNTASDNSIWHVGRDTYINGVMGCIDFDYEGMYLLEVCDRDPDDRSDPTAVRWLAVAYGTGSSGGTKHEWYPATEPQEFFKRTVNQWDVIEWAIAWYKAIDLAGRERDT